MKSIRLAAILAILLALAAPALAASRSATQPPAPDPNAQGIVDFFKGESAPSPKSLDFQVDSGFADIKTEAPESSGRYFLAGQAISAVAPDIYKLELTFKKKYQRDPIDLTPEYFFTQQRAYYFWYNGGNRIVFRVGGRKKEFKIPKKELTEIKVKSLETYSIQKTKLSMDLVIPDGASQVYLQISFK